MSIQEHLNKIRNAIYGREVRESIAKGIETAYDDASEKDNANMEVKIARGTHPNLRSRLEEVDNKQQQTTAQLAQKVGSGVKAEPEDLSERTLGLVTGDGGPISIESVPQNDSVTYDKMTPQVRNDLSFLLENKIQNGNFSGGTNHWQVRDTSGSPTTVITTSNGALISTANGTNANPQFRQVLPTTSGKFLVKCKFKVKNDLPTAISVFLGSKEIRYNRSDYLINEWNEVSTIVESVDVTHLGFIHRYSSAELATGETLEVDDVMVINLSEANLERASKGEVESLLAHLPDSYLEGTQNLFNARNVLKYMNTGENENMYRISQLKDFGAVGDGVADDSTAIERALNSGGIIIINPGTYKFTKTFKIKSNTLLLGFGENSKFILGNNFSLSSTPWRPEGSTVPDYFPYFVTEYGSENIEIKDIVIEGNKNQFVDQIQVGLAIETAKKIRINNVRISNVNYFPSEAPPRPSGQFRTGWNFAAFRSKDIIVDSSVFEYGGYETFRVGDETEDLILRNSKLQHGWRTVFQILRGAKNITMDNCTINQDDFGTNDSHAAITFHASLASAPIENVTIKNTKINAKLFLENPNGGNGISFVGDYFKNFKFIDMDIVSNGSGISPRVIDDILLDGVTINAEQIGISLSFIDAKKVRILRSKIKSATSYALNAIGGTSDLIIDDTDFESGVGVAGVRLAHRGGDLSFKESSINADGLGMQLITSKYDVFAVDDNDITSVNNHTMYISDIEILKRLSINGNTLTPRVSNKGIHGTASAKLKNGFIDRNVFTQGSYAVSLSAPVSKLMVKNNVVSDTTNGVDVPEGVLTEGNI